MLRSKVFYSVCILFLCLCASCTKETSTLWGETECYDDFLWVKYVPDTLKKTLCFDFNEDATNHMTKPLRLGLFKKTDKGFVQLKGNEVELFVDGKKIENNIISVSQECNELEIGIVLNKNIQNQSHFWYIRAIDNAGLERINDSNVESLDAIMDIRVKKTHVMNPLANFFMWLLGLIAVALFLWFALLQRLFYPTFKVNKVTLIGPEPYLNSIKIKGCRKLVLTSKNIKQTFINKIFTGEIKYSNSSIWSEDVVFEPRDKKSIRIRPDKNDYMVDARIISINNDCALENVKHKTKTTIKIS